MLQFDVFNAVLDFAQKGIDPVLGNIAAPGIVTPGSARSNVDFAAVSEVRGGRNGKTLPYQLFNPRNQHPRPPQWQRHKHGSARCWTYNRFAPVRKNARLRESVDAA